MNPYKNLESSFCYDEYHFDDHWDFVEHLCNYCFDSLEDLTEDWTMEVFSTKLEALVTLTPEAIGELIISANEERFSQDDCENEENRIYKALALVDFSEAQKLIPSLFYPTEQVFLVSKSDVIEGVKEYFSSI